MLSNYEAVIKVLDRAMISCESSIREESAFKFTYVVVIPVQFLEGCWTEGFHFWLAVGQRLPSVPCHISLSIWHLVSSEQARDKSQRECQNEGERVSKTEVTVFYSLILQLMSPHFCHSLSVRSKSVG